MALIDPKSLKEQYQSSLTAMKPYWDSFDEYERIARNKPHPKVIANKLPTVTDGTLSGVINSQPKRIIQQIPTGRVWSPDMPDLADISNYVWQDQIIPNISYNGNLFQKSLIMTKKALTYGVSVSYAFFKVSGDYFGADFSIPYIRDIILEKGKTYGPDCDLLYMRQWYTPAQIQMIIDKEERLKKQSKKRGDDEPYDPSWNIPLLKRLKEIGGKQKSADALTANERDKTPNAGLIEIIHAFQKGVGATFYSFSPALEEGKNIVREKKNTDPRGEMPLKFMYAEADLSNPLGVGYAELSGGMQNLLDSEVQRYQLAQALMLNPPIMKWGTGIKGATLKFKSNAVWDMGSDPNSKVEAVDINNHAIANFVSNYGLVKSQILNLTNNQDSSIPGSTNGNTNQSKTSQGVAQQQQRIGFDDNYMRKQFESWFEANAETMLNIHFAENKGSREIELSQEFVEDIQPNMKESKLVKVDKKKNIATISYDDINTKLRFRVDPTSSESPDDQDQIQNLKELLTEASSNPMIQYYLANDGYDLHLGEGYKDLFQRLGVANVSKIIVKTPQQQGPDGQPAQGQAPQNPMMLNKPKATINFKDVVAYDPAAGVQMLQQEGIQVDPQAVADKQQADVAATKAKAAQGASSAQLNAAKTSQTVPPPNPDEVPPSQSGQLGPNDEALVKQMLAGGYSSEQALHAVELMHQGHTTQEIIQAIGQPQPNQPLGV